MALLNRTLAIVRWLPPSVALLLVSSAVLAEVPDDEYLVRDDESSVSRAGLVIDGDTYSVVVGAQCAVFSSSSNSPAVGSLLEVASDHPDRVQVKKKGGGVEQAQKDNPPTVRIVTGSGIGQVENWLVCDKLDLGADVKTKKSPYHGSFEASGRTCACDDSEELEGADCGAFTAQVNQLVTDCQNDKTLDVSYDGGVLKRFKIKGKGSAFLASDVPD